MGPYCGLCNGNFNANYCNFSPRNFPGIAILEYWYRFSFWFHSIYVMGDVLNPRNLSGVSCGKIQNCHVSYRNRPYGYM